MLPQEKRLTREDFTAVGAGKRVITTHFSCTKQESSFLKVAIVISKKVAKKATDRNLLKRRVHAVIHKKSPPKGVYIIYARKNSQTLSYKEIEQELTTLLSLGSSV